MGSSVELIFVHFLVIKRILYVSNRLTIAYKKPRFRNFRNLVMRFSKWSTQHYNWERMSYKR